MAFHGYHHITSTVTSARGLAATRFERLGDRRILFTHPDGIDYQLVEVAVDGRAPWTGADVPAAAAIRGVHSVTVCAQEIEELDLFLHEGMGLRSRDADGALTSYAMAHGVAGQLVEVAELERTQPLG